jgi:hypothetical protein
MARKFDNAADWGSVCVKEFLAIPLAEPAEPQRIAEYNSPLRALRVPAPPRENFAGQPLNIDRTAKNPPFLPLSNELIIKL